MATEQELPGRLDLLGSSPELSSASSPSHRARLARSEHNATAGSYPAGTWAERRRARREQPFPSPLRRLASALQLALLVVSLGVLVAALLGALAVAVVLIGSHLVGA